MSAALVGCCLFASAAAAEGIVVNQTEDIPGEGCGITEPCTLRQAIVRANETQEADEIDFDLDGFGPPPYTLGLQEVLPRIENPVTIDGTSVSGYAGTPLIFIDGAEATPTEEATTFEVFADDTTIQGLAMGNLLYGVYVNNAKNLRLCGNYIGTDTTGTEAQPFEDYGVELGPNAENVAIGAGCPEQRGNLISANGKAGIYDRGDETEISANLIGLDRSGQPLPNAGPGVVLGAPVDVPSAVHPVVGAHGGDPGNVIAFNEGPGVFVENAFEINASILGNSIYDNAGLGIEIEGEQPPVPVLAAVGGDTHETTVDGSLSGEPGETYVLELFDNSACDPLGAGEGQTMIGSKSVVADSLGQITFSLDDLAPVALAGDPVTATATDLTTGTTSQFSACRAQAVPPSPEPVVPVVPKGIAPAGPTPVNGETIVVAPAQGKILVKRPGEKQFHLLADGEEIPVGSIVDATNGKVTLTSVDANGNTQTAVFYGGAFKVVQRDGSGLVVLKLTGNFQCAKAGSSATVSKKKSGRKLWGSGKGDFRSEGKHGSATVRGTKWLTEDRCGGTFFKVASGVVTVKNFDDRTTRKLKPGETYFTG